MEATSSALRQVAITTFEDLAFLFADEPVPGAAPAAEGSALVAEIAFEGAASGRLRVRASRRLAERATAEMLAMDVGVDEATVRDAFGELGNVICGGTLPQLLHGRAVCRLAKPVVAGSAQGAEPGTGQVRLCVNNEIVELWLELEPTNAEPS